MSQTTSGSGRSGKKVDPPRNLLTGKVFGVMLLVSLVPLAVLGGAWLKESSSRIREENERLMSQTAEGLTAQVDEWMDKNVRLLQAAAKMPAVVGMSGDAQEPVMKAVQEACPWMYLVFTIAMDGKNIARSDDKPLSDYSDRLYYRDVALLGQPLAWQNIMGRSSGKPSVVMAVPIIRNGVRVGVMAGGMTIENISKAVATWHKGKTGFAFLLDEQNKVIGHPNNTMVTAQADLQAHALVRAVRRDPLQTQAVTFTDPEGNTAIGLGRVNKYGWLLGIEQTEEEVFADLRQAQVLGVGFLAITFFVVSFVALMTARALVRPIVQLTEAADRMSMGDLDVKIDIRARDEIGMLAQAFGRMQISLRQAMQRLQGG